jgi:predicted XRE-type DNA-binding protein
MNNYYIYIYLDPRKSGRYCYDDVCFTFEPIYVGKGKNGRWKEINRRTNVFKNKINKIKKSGLEPVIFKLYENLNEDQSFEKEIQLINEIGRIDLKTGTLVNMTDGGDGLKGYLFSSESKNKMSKRVQGKYNPMFDIHRFGKDAPNFGKNHSKETKKKLSIKLKNRIISEETKNKMSKSHIGMIGKNHSEETKSKISKKLKEKRSKNYILLIQDIIQIKLLLKEGKLTQKEIADIFEVDKTTISKIKNNKRWNHIKI